MHTDSDEVDEFLAWAKENDCSHEAMERALAKTAHLCRRSRLLRTEFWYAWIRALVFSKLKPWGRLDARDRLGASDRAIGRALAPVPAAPPLTEERLRKILVDNLAGAQAAAACLARGTQDGAHGRGGGADHEDQKRERRREGMSYEAENWARLSPRFRQAHNRLRAARGIAPIPEPEVDLYVPPPAREIETFDPRSEEGVAAARQFLGPVIAGDEGFEVRTPYADAGLSRCRITQRSGNRAAAELLRRQLKRLETRGR